MNFSSANEEKNVHDAEEFINANIFPEGMMMRIGNSEKNVFKVLEVSYQRKKFPVPNFATRIPLNEPNDYVRAQIRQFYRQYHDIATKYNQKITEMEN